MAQLYQSDVDEAWGDAGADDSRRSPTPTASTRAPDDGDRSRLSRPLPGLPPVHAAASPALASRSPGPLAISGSSPADSSPTLRGMPPPAPRTATTNTRASKPPSLNINSSLPSASSPTLRSLPPPVPRGALARGSAPPPIPRRLDPAAACIVPALARASQTPLPTPPAVMPESTSTFEPLDRDALEPMALSSALESLTILSERERDRHDATLLVRSRREAHDIRRRAPWWLGAVVVLGAAASLVVAVIRSHRAATEVPREVAVAAPLQPPAPTPPAIAPAPRGEPRAEAPTRTNTVAKPQAVASDTPIRNKPATSTKKSTLKTTKSIAKHTSTSKATSTSKSVKGEPAKGKATRKAKDKAVAKTTKASASPATKAAKKPAAATRTTKPATTKTKKKSTATRTPKSTATAKR